jgi:hypothetical protein
VTGSGMLVRVETFQVVVNVRTICGPARPGEAARDGVWKANKRLFRFVRLSQGIISRKSGDTDVYDKCLERCRLVSCKRVVLSGRLGLSRESMAPISSGCHSCQQSAISLRQPPRRGLIS